MEEILGSVEGGGTVFHATYNLEDEAQRKIYSDQTGHFPTHSYKGMQYVMVVTELTTNGILVERLKNRTSGEMVAAYEKIINKLKASNATPTLHILDNKILQVYKEAIAENGIKYQLVPAHDYRRNIAKRPSNYSKTTS